MIMDYKVDYDNEDMGLDMNSFTSLIHYYNEIDWLIKRGELSGKFDFLENQDLYTYDIPEDCANRYILFKESVAQFYYNDYYKEYRDLALREIDKNIIYGLLAEIEIIKNHHEYIVGNPKYPTHYLAAVKFINRIGEQTYNVDENVRKIIASYTEEQVIAYTCILHSSNYFDRFPIPYEVFYADSIDSPFRFIGEVYGKYLLLYDMLQKEKEGILEDLGENPPVIIKNSTKQIKIDNKLGWNFENLVNPHYKAKVQTVFSILKEKNPLAEVLKKSGVLTQEFDMNALYTNGNMKILKSQIVHDYDDKRIIVIHAHGIKTFWQELFTVLIEKKWILILENHITTTHEAIQCNFLANYEDNPIYRIERSGIKTSVEDYPNGAQYIDFINLLTNI